MNHLSFQYCQKIVVFNEKDSTILLCRRVGEADYNGTYSFIGGKMEVTDCSIIEGLKREKDEEIGANVQLEILVDYNTATFFKKKDGNSMILPHYYARYVGGEIKLSEEYDDYKRVHIDELSRFEPMIHTIPIMTKKLLSLKKSLGDKATYLSI